jgi:MFS family permease
MRRSTFAWSIWSLIAFRVISGAGGALFPLSFAIIRDEFPPEKVKVGSGLLSAVFGVGGGFGIGLSGVIVDNFSWRLLFLLGSIPVASRSPLFTVTCPSRRSGLRPASMPGALLLWRPALADGGAHGG